MRSIGDILKEHHEQSQLDEYLLATKISSFYVTQLQPIADRFVKLIGDRVLVYKTYKMEDPKRFEIDEKVELIIPFSAVHLYIDESIKPIIR